jgi:hypothetical protein
VFEFCYYTKEEHQEICLEGTGRQEKVKHKSIVVAVAVVVVSM